MATGKAMLEDIAILGGVAVINVGAATETEMKEKRNARAPGGMGGMM